MGCSGLLTGQHVTAMVGEPDHGHRPQTQQVTKGHVSHLSVVGVGEVGGNRQPAIKPPWFLPFPVQAWGSQSHTGKGYSHLRSTLGPQGCGNSRRLLGLPGGLQQMAQTYALPHMLPHPRKENSSAFTPCFCSEKQLSVQNRKPIYYLHQVPSTQAFKITGWQSGPQQPKAA